MIIPQYGIYPAADILKLHRKVLIFPISSDRFPFLELTQYFQQEKSLQRRGMFHTDISQKSAGFVSFNSHKKILTGLCFFVFFLYF